MKRELLIFFCILLSEASEAGLFLGPYIGISNGEGETKINGQDTYEHSFNGRIFGAKLGYLTESRYFYGVHYNQNDFLLDTKQSLAFSSDQVKRNSYSIFLGKKVSFLWIYADYIFKGEMNGKEDPSSSNQFLSKNHKLDKKKGVRLGVSLYITPSLMAHADYSKYEYERFTNSGVNISGFQSSSFNQFNFYVSYMFGAKECFLEELCF